MTTFLNAVNLLIRFLLELCLLAALAYWGYRAGQGPLLKAVLAIGAPLLAAVVWSLYVAPRASHLLQDPARLLIELALFGAASAGLALAGRPTLGWLLGAVFVLNRLALAVWKG